MIRAVGARLFFLPPYIPMGVRARYGHGQSYSDVIMRGPCVKSPDAEAFLRRRNNSAPIVFKVGGSLTFSPPSPKRASSAPPPSQPSSRGVFFKRQVGFYAGEAVSRDARLGVLSPNEKQADVAQPAPNDGNPAAADHGSIADRSRRLRHSTSPASLGRVR
jgi:hypothetical protein